MHPFKGYYWVTFDVSFTSAKLKLQIQNISSPTKVFPYHFVVSPSIHLLSQATTGLFSETIG